jgi:hypothetical protein
MKGISWDLIPILTAFLLAGPLAAVRLIFGMGPLIVAGDVFAHLLNPVVAALTVVWAFEVWERHAGSTWGKLWVWAWTTVIGSFALQVVVFACAMLFTGALWHSVSAPVLWILWPLGFGHQVSPVYFGKGDGLILVITALFFYVPYAYGEFFRPDKKKGARGVALKPPSL